VTTAFALDGRRFFVVAALRAVLLRLRVVAAFLPAARRLRVTAAFFAVARRLRATAGFFAAALRFLVAAFFAAAIRFSIPVLRGSCGSAAASVTYPQTSSFYPARAWPEAHYVASRHAGTA
jgi:hypothetical protein